MQATTIVEIAVAVIAVASFIVRATSISTQAMPVIGFVMRVLDRLSILVHNDAQGLFQWPLFAKSVARAVIEEASGAPPATKRPTIVPPLPLLMLVLVGCAGSALRTHALVADRVALSLNTALPTVITIYRNEGDAAIAAAPTQAAAREAIAQIRERWCPLWGGCEAHRTGAWDVVRTAHNAWAETLDRAQRCERGGSSNCPTQTDVLTVLGRVREAYCALRGAVPRDVNLPEIPGLPCGGAQ